MPISVTSGASSADFGGTASAPAVFVASAAGAGVVTTGVETVGTTGAASPAGALSAGAGAAGGGAGTAAGSPAGAAFSSAAKADAEEPMNSSAAATADSDPEREGDVLMCINPQASLREVTGRTH